jgi:hypothetical protein
VRNTVDRLVEWIGLGLFQPAAVKVKRGGRGSVGVAERAANEAGVPAGKVCDGVQDALGEEEQGAGAAVLVAPPGGEGVQAVAGDERLSRSGSAPAC